MIRRLEQSLVWLLSAGGSVLLVLAVLLRLTVRDRFRGLSAIFYGTPWPVITAGGALLALLWQHQHRRKLCGAHIMLCAVALVVWLATSWKSHPLPAARGDLRVVLWNVARPTTNLPAMARWLRAQDADIIALAEGYRKGESSVAAWARELPGYEAVELRGEMICLVRGRILSADDAPRATDLKSALLRVSVRDQPVTLLQVDISPSWIKSRRRAFAELTAQVRAHLDENLIVLGDFNTPRESALLDPLRTDLTHAFEAAGRGLAETWPVPLPVLSLDQIWTARTLRPVRCTHGYSIRSDHRAVTADFVFAPQ